MEGGDLGPEERTSKEGFADRLRLAGWPLWPLYVFVRGGGVGGGGALADAPLWQTPHTFRI